MKLVTKISVFLNLVLLGCLCLELIKRTQSVTVPQPVRNDTRKVDEATAASVIAKTPMPAQPQPFQWNQLYDQDYHVYVKNLRAIGCPEPTLRAIVTADVGVAIERQATELDRKLADFRSGSWSSQLAGWTNENNWKAQLQRLPDEQTAMIAYYLGESTLVSSAPAVQENAAGDGPDVIIAPLIELPVDVVALNLDASQSQAVDDLRALFLQRVGGQNQDANDPGCRARWRAAQAESDDLLKGMLGEEAYEAYESQALAGAQLSNGAQAGDSFP